MSLKRLDIEIKKLGLEVEEQHRRSSRSIAPTISFSPAALLFTTATTTVPNETRRDVQQRVTPSLRSRKGKCARRDRKSANILFASASASAARRLQDSEQEEDSQSSPCGVLASAPEQAAGLHSPSASDFVEQEAMRRRLERYTAKRRQEGEEEEEQQLSDQSLMVPRRKKRRKGKDLRKHVLLKNARQTLDGMYW